MNIVFIVDTYNNASGGSIATKRLVEELRKRNHNVKVVGAVNDDVNDPDFYNVPGFNLPLGKSTQENLNFKLGIGKKEVLQKAMQDADIVQIQFPFLLGKAAVKIAKDVGIPVIGSFHVQPQNLLFAVGLQNKFFENIIWIIFKYLLFNRVKTIISPSVFASNLLKSQGVKANHISIPNGITSEYINDNNIEPKSLENEFVIVSIGRFSSEKRHSLIIDAIKKSIYKDKIKLILIGSGVLKDSLIKQSEDLPVKPMIGYVNDTDKIKYLNTSDLYIHSSLIELESLSTAEAIGCGLPCLISNSKDSAASQFAVDNRFIFEAGNIEDLTTKINYWYENREELSSNGLKNKVIGLASEYKFDKSVGKYENIYSSLIKSN